MDSKIDRADFLSRIVDYDDWRVKRDYFVTAEAKWGSHSVDWFVNHANAQLAGFYSRFWCNGTEGVNAFLFHGLARITGSFFPFFLFPESLITLPVLGVEAPWSFQHGLPLLFDR